mmetsp:Transcript_24508/g.39272  ORF Transcript_24508/g.39272 Transcript_24508/m.39272 type:complete len:491 (-) Transcript_24508:26-1498(-)
MEQVFATPAEAQARITATKEELRKARSEAADAQLARAQAEAAVSTLGEYSNTLVTTWKKLRANMGECKEQLKTLQQEHETQERIDKAERHERKLRKELADVHAQLAKVETEKKDLQSELNEARATLQKSKQDAKPQQEASNTAEAVKATDPSVSTESAVSPVGKQTSTGFVGGVVGTSMSSLPGIGNGITGMGLGGSPIAGMGLGGNGITGMGLGLTGGPVTGMGGMGLGGMGLTGGSMTGLGGMGLVGGSMTGIGGMGLAGSSMTGIGGMGLNGGSMTGLGGMGLTGGPVAGMGLGLNNGAGGSFSPLGILGSGSTSPKSPGTTDTAKLPDKELESPISKPSSPKATSDGKVSPDNDKIVKRRIAAAADDSQKSPSSRVSQSPDAAEVINIHSDSDDDSDDSVDMPVVAEAVAPLTIEELISFERTLEDMATGIADIVVSQAKDAVVRIARRSQRLDTPRSVIFRERMASIIEIAPRAEPKPVVAAFKF